MSTPWRRGDNRTRCDGPCLVVRFRYWPNRDWGDWVSYRIAYHGYIPCADELWAPCAELVPDKAPENDHEG